VTGTGVGPLTVSQPVPPARALPPGYDRHDPDLPAQRAALSGLVGEPDWAARSWSELVEDLLALGRTDIPLSRLAEGHIDAHRILAQAGVRPVRGALYGVWASRSQQTGIRATQAEAGGRLRLDGTLRFASGAGLLERALVPAWLDGGTHLLLDLPVDELPVDAGVWRTSAMAASRSYELRLVDVGVDGQAQVGPPDFYLNRPGFFPGGVGVAACWAGGGARLLDLLQDRITEPSPAQQVRLGRLRTDLAAALAVVRSGAALLDRSLTLEGPSFPVADTGQALATEVRAAVADAIRRMVGHARLAAGPAGMAMDEGLSHAVLDLELYALQQNSDADALLLGGQRAMGTVVNQHTETRGT
jgi:alkylation response protein AidB-like acyl-CoA dehydrogenase